MSQRTALRARPLAALRGRSVPLIGAGLALLVAGTFLPWLRSGSVERNSYATGGALRELLGSGGGIGLALNVWPFVSLACAAALGLLILGVSRGGALLAVVVALATGALGVSALAVHTGFTVAPARLGPAVTAAGAALALLAAVPVLILGRTP